MRAVDLLRLAPYRPVLPPARVADKDAAEAAVALAAVRHSVRRVLP